jgi:hypothetical protein
VVDPSFEALLNVSRPGKAGPSFWYSRLRAGNVGRTPLVLRLRSLIAIAYLIAGLIVAANDNYLRHLENVRQVVSALLAIVLWPLVLLGVDLHIRG